VLVAKIRKTEIGATRRTLIGNGTSGERTGTYSTTFF
jgi:hypothetical protein